MKPTDESAVLHMIQQIKDDSENYGDQMNTL